MPVLRVLIRTIRSSRKHSDNIAPDGMPVPPTIGSGSIANRSKRNLSTLASQDNDDALTAHQYKWHPTHPGVYIDDEMALTRLEPVQT
jgi:hypothetical protein